MNIAAIMSVSADCYYEPKTVAVRQILRDNGWVIFEEVEEVWTGFMAKVRWAHECARTLTNYTHLMLIDARDVVLLAGPDEVLERFKEFDHPWVMNAEPHIWPQGMVPEDEYPKCDGPYRFLNSGAFIAERTHLLNCLDRWPRGGTRLAHLVMKGEDQPFYTENYLEEPDAIMLDHGCYLFQCMCGSDWLCDVTPGSLYNRKMGSHPLIIHFNGGTDITAPERRLLWDRSFRV